MKSSCFRISTNPDLILTVYATQSWRERALGLLAIPALNVAEALLIAPCNMIHTFGMAYPIDLFFLNERKKVIGVSKNLKPTRVRLNLRASMVLEMAAGEADRLGINQSTVFLTHS